MWSIAIGDLTERQVLGMTGLHDTGTTLQYSRAAIERFSPAARHAASKQRRPR
ncbi:hypothetical protein [Nonomuraea rubra]|uniref:hypothetical protein n=1 Tax=Nonomuraea rubra TaxID=46180 RepID=UPI0033E31464